jgi:anti-anti-sigma factor
MDVEESRVNGTVTITLLGEIRGIDSILFSKRIERYREADCTRIVIDLQGVTFIDSTAIGGLIYLNKTMKKYGHDVVIRSPSEHVQNIFNECNLNSVLTIEKKHETTP